MTNHGAPEPTNEELWAQPPTAPYHVPPAAHQANLPVPQVPGPQLPVPAGSPAKQNHGVLALAITSLGVGVPLTAIAVSEAGMGGLIVAWIGIVGVNAVYAWSRRR